jgi:hypothetical protein
MNAPVPTPDAAKADVMVELVMAAFTAAALRPGFGYVPVKPPPAAPDAPPPTPAAASAADNAAICDADAFSSELVKDAISWSQVTSAVMMFP